MDNSNEDFWLQYHDGSSWHTIGSWARNIDFNNDTFYHETVNITSAQYTFSANARLRFVCDASGNADYVYIDEAQSSGLTAGGVDAMANLTRVVPSEINLSANYPNPFLWLR